MKTLDCFYLPSFKGLCFGALILVFSSFPQAHAQKLLNNPTIGGSFGVQVKPERTTDQDLDQIKAMGFGFVRFDFRWTWIERRHGHYDWRVFDAFIAKLRSRGLKAMMVLDGGNEIYSGTTEPDPSKPYFGSSTMTAAPTSEEDQKAFASFSAAAVEHFGSKDIIWEIWNEPDTRGFWPPYPDSQAYARLASFACEAIREKDPDATIIGPAASKMPSILKPWEQNFIKPILDSPAAACFDALSFHSYRLHEPPESVSLDYKISASYIAKHTPHPLRPLPIVNSEWGYSTAVSTPEQQAAYVLRTHILNRLNGVPLSVWFEWKNPELPYVPADDSENHFGLVDENGAFKPAATALAKLLPFLQKAVIERRVDLKDSQVYAIIVRQQNNAYNVLAWTNNEDPASTLILDIEDKGRTKTYLLSMHPQLIAISTATPKIKLKRGLL